MYLLIIILLLTLIVIFLIAIFVRLFYYKKQIRDITKQIREFKERKTNKKINIQIVDKDIEELAFEVNEYLELYKRNEQEKVVFENTLKQGIANMSHDLRTPLTSIIGYLKLLQNNDIDKEEALDILREKADKLNTLINNFFELASIESEDYELDMEKVNLNTLVQDEILSLYEAFESKGLKPKINILDKSIFIMGDKDSIERIIDNLLSNVLKYAEKDVEISLEGLNNKAIFRISNVCTGIDEESAAHIFDRFYIADQVRRGQGVGLGLAITKSLMEKMGGTITSKVEGDRFFIICEWKLLES